MEKDLDVLISLRKNKELVAEALYKQFAAQKSNTELHSRLTAAHDEILNFDIQIKKLNKEIAKLQSRLLATKRGEK